MNISLAQKIILFGVLTTHLSCAQRKPKYYSVSGKVTKTASYCGGAAPSKEMLDELATPKPVSRKQLFIKSGKENATANSVIKTFTTDSLGQFNFQLKNGTYCIVEEYKSKALLIPKNDANSKWDANCLKEEYAKCDFQLNVAGKNVTDIKINFSQPCSWSRPCLEYNGPLPPSAPPGR